MKKLRFFKRIFLLIIVMVFLLCVPNAFSQAVVGLDNWFNHETNAKTGKPFHYLWSDTENSGYSRWGEIFTGRGARITTIGQPVASVLNKINTSLLIPIVPQRQQNLII